MKILALDLGTKTGWALAGDRKLLASGMQEQKGRRFDGGGMRYLRFRNWLSEVKQDAGGLDAVFFEEVRRHIGTDAAHVYGGLLAMLTAWCEENKIPYEGVPVGTIKKHATGKGNTKKEGMKAAALKLWPMHSGDTIEDDNEADAMCLLHFAVFVLMPAPTKRQRIRAQ